MTARLQRIPSPFPHTPLSHADVEQSIPERFAQQVCLHGDRLAIQHEDVAPASFAELNRTTNALARRILARRDRRSEPIALLFDHGADVVAAMLAVLKAGKFYVLLDASSPAERLQYVLSHSQAALIIADRHHLSLAGDLADSGPDVLAFADPDESASDADLGIYPSPSDLATIIYTSGSTGKPKGVMHTHRNILGDMRHVINELAISPEDRWVWHTSVSFAGSARTIFGALLNGSALYPFDLKRHLFAQLATWLLRHEITVFRSVPTTFRSFMTALPDDLVFPAVRILSMGGEPLFRADVDSFNRHFLPHAVLVHPFGPTECMLACWNVIPHGETIAEHKVAIGAPLEDTTVLILGEDRRPVADGEIGEIAVKSAFLSPGYWRDPDQTDAVFLNGVRDSDDRLYLTGDLGMRTSDGRLTHVGRRDFQVKIRGFRIDLSEIEAALRALDTIRDAVVVGRPNGLSEMRLIAYVVPTTRPLALAPLREALARSLPEYMIPSVFVTLDALPQTPSGKTDRLRLPAIDATRPDSATPFAPPGSPLEAALLSIWIEALGITWLGVHDNFFEVGGDSLGALRIVAQIKAALGVELSLAELFDAPTVAATANAISIRRSADV